VNDVYQSICAAESLNVTKMRALAVNLWKQPRKCLSSESTLLRATCLSGL